MASTVLKDRIANWPEGQVEKGIQKPTHQLDIRNVRLLERIFKCDHPVAVRSILALVALAGIDPRFGCGFDAMSFLPFMPWHFLYFFPLPQGHGSFLPTFRTILPVPRTARSDFSSWIQTSSSLYHATATLRASKSNGEPVTSWIPFSRFCAHYYASRAALLDGIKFSVIDFWRVCPLGTRSE